jgi:hypothetical protein
MLRLARLQRTLRLVDRGLEQAFLDAVEGGALLDQIALLEQDCFQVAFDARPDVDPIDRLDPADEIERLCDRLLLGGDRADRNGGRRALLRLRGQSRHADENCSPSYEAGNGKKHGP